MQIDQARLQNIGIIEIKKQVSQNKLLTYLHFALENAIRQFLDTITYMFNMELQISLSRNHATWQN